MLQRQTKETVLEKGMAYLSQSAVQGNEQAMVLLSKYKKDKSFSLFFNRQQEKIDDVAIDLPTKNVANKNKG